MSVRPSYERCAAAATRNLALCLCLLSVLTVVCNARDNALVLAMTPENPDLIVGRRLQLIASPFIRKLGKYVVAPTPKKIDWAYDAPLIANVDADGVVTGLAVGCASVTASVPEHALSAKTKVCVTPPKQYAYLGAQAGFIDAFQVDAATGALTRVAGAPFKYGLNPTALATDPKNHFLFVADIANDQFSVLAIDPNSGWLYQRGVYSVGKQPEAIAVDPSGRFVYVVNRSSDAVAAFAIDGETGLLHKIEGSPFNTGKFPRSIAILPSGRFAYVSNYLDSTVTSFQIDSYTGKLTEIGPRFATPQSPEFISIEPSGDRAFVGTLGEEAILTLKIDPVNGSLSFVSKLGLTLGGGPFASASTRDGRFLFICHEGWGAVGAYAVSAKGEVSALKDSPYSITLAPLTVAMDMSRQFLYAPNVVHGEVYGFVIDPENGTLRAIGGSPFKTSGSPFIMVFAQPD